LINASPEDKAIKYTIDFVSIPSFSGEEKELALHIRDLLRDQGFDKVIIDRVGNVIAIVKGTTWNEPLILEGHMDHVDPGNLELWHYKPFSAKIVENKVYGRGTVDMKAALASMVAATEYMLKHSFKRTLALVFTVLEEPAEGVGFKIAIEETVKEKPFLVVLGEATSLNVNLGHRGRALIKTVIKGKTAHASMPHLGLNPIIALSKMIKYIEKIELPEHGILGKATIAPTIINCSPKCSSQVPDLCEIILDRRTILGEDERDILKSFTIVHEKLASEGYKVEIGIFTETIKCWTGAKVDVKYFFPSWLISKKSSLAVKSLNVIRSKVNPNAEFKIWNFSTDGVYSAGKRNILTIGFGPGNEKLAHQPNEYISIEDIRRATRGYMELIREFALEE